PQNWETRGFQPRLKNIRINGAEIGGEFQVAVNKVCGRETRISSNQAGLRFSSSEKHDGGRAVIGPAAGVFLNTPAKFAEGHDEDAFEVALSFEVIEEGFDRIAEFLQQTVLRNGLIRVRVVAALRDVVNARRQTAADQPGNELQ